MKTAGRRTGFSLIEVIVAMMVLAIMLLTLISVFIYGFGAVSRIRQTTLATQITQEQMEYIRNLTYAQITALGTTFTNDKLSRLVNGQGVRAVEAGLGDDIKKVSVGVTWSYRGQTLRKDIVTYMTRLGINKK